MFPPLFLLICSFFLCFLLPLTLPSSISCANFRCSLGTETGFQGKSLHFLACCTPAVVNANGTHKTTNMTKPSNDDNHETPTPSSTGTLKPLSILERDLSWSQRIRSRWPTTVLFSKTLGRTLRHALTTERRFAGTSLTCWQRSVSPPLPLPGEVARWTTMLMPIRHVQ